MSNKVLLKKSSVAAKVPLTTDLDYGELALNYADGKLYFKNSSNAVQSFGSTSYIKVTTNTTAIAGKGYIADTTAGTFTITLPASPATGDSVTIADGASFLTTPLTVSRNGSTISDVADDLSLNIEGVSVTFVYDGNTWEVYTQVGAQGGDGNVITASGTTTFTNKTVSLGSNTITGTTSQFNTALTDGDFATLAGTETLTNKTLTSPTISGTIAGDHSMSGIVTLNYTGASSVSTLNITGYNSKGGTGYHDFLRATNGYGSATNASKWFRLNSTGNLEIINSAYTALLLSLSDGGDLVIAGSLTMANRPAFRVTGAGTTNINATNTLTSTNFAVDYNQGSYLNATTGVFTAPIAGLYQVGLVARSSGSASISAIQVQKTSGATTTTQIYLEWGGSSSAYHMGGSAIVKMAVNDTLKLIVTSGTVTFDGNDQWSVAYIG
jgi:hypothetical protein